MNINNLLSTGPAPSPSKPAPPPQQQQQQQQLQHQQSLPSTPVQNVPSQSFRDYSQHPQASPTRGLSRDYGVQQMPQGPYGSPTAYQRQAPQGPYPGRPAPPPLQPLPPNDLRSPSIASVLGPGPSPYRQTPTSSVSTASGGYFPPPQQTPTSPGQRHQYPQPVNAYPHRDGYVQNPGPGGGQVTTPGPSPYMQGPPPLPQTPPVGAPGATHHYIQQRTASGYSANTPTSAQSQHSYGPQFGSPVSITHPLPLHLEHTRQHSQPPTPLGPPPAGPRPQSIPHGYAQPASPYQQRVSLASVPYPPHQTTHMSPRTHHSQISPPQPPPPSATRLPSNHSIYDNPVLGDPSRRSQSQSERDRSVSVSPKTRVPSLPNSSGHPALSQLDTDFRGVAHMGLTVTARSSLDPEREREHAERAITPAKRKLEERDLGPEELEKQDIRPPPFQAQDGYPSKHVVSEFSPASTSPVMPRKKRIRHSKPPVWAGSYTEGERLNAGNFILRKHAHSVGMQVNGKHDSAVKPELASRHASPDEKRSTVPSQPPSAPHPTPAPAPPPNAIPNADLPLGPWECSITGTKPYNEVVNRVADFLFLNVVKNPDIGEIESRNVQFEVEAKMGTLIDRDKDRRVALPVMTECVLADNGRVAFQSNMTEAQHKAFNDYLNSLVVEAFPPNRVSKPRRVQIMYKHTMETDKFFELPPALREQRLPACVQNLIPAKHKVKVRVTYDQNTGRQLAMIVKARVANLDLHFPTCPFDCRISVNLEMAWDGSIEELERLSVGREVLQDRRKNRLSYTHSLYQIDLTQVTHTVTGLLQTTQRTEKEHEIEIEVSTAALMAQGRLAESGQNHQYVELIEGFIDNVRILARKATEFGPSG